MAASLLHTYPIHGRLLLFFVPCLVIFIADGVAEVFDKTKQHQPLIGILFVFILFLYPSLNALKYTINPRTREEIRPVISYIDKHKQNGDVLYIYYDAESAYKYYSRMFNRNKDDYIVGVPSNHNWTGYEKDIDKLRGKKRVWFLFSHVYPPVGFNQMDFYLMHLNKVGKKLDEFRAPGAFAFLYNMNEQN